MSRQISPEDLKSLRTFTPGIWDARAVHESLTGLAERTGAIAFAGKRWDWTDAGHELMLAAQDEITALAAANAPAVVAPSFEEVLNQRVKYVDPTGQVAAFTGVVRRADPTSNACVVLVSDADDRIYNVKLARLTLVVAPSLEDDLRAMVVQLEALAQCCGDGAGGLARAVVLATDAAQLRGLLTRHGHDCAPCKVYSSSEEALAALTKAGG